MGFEVPLLRPATEGDAERVAVLASQLGYPTTPEAIRERLHLLKAQEDHQVLVAQVGGRVMGWVHVGRTLSLEAGDRSELLGLVVDETCRGRGLGRALVAEAEAWAWTRGLPILHVRANVTREATHRFYGKLEFEAVKRQVVFRKRLEPSSR